LLHYLVKFRNLTLTIDNNEFILGSACVSSENFWDHKIIENLLLRLYFKIVSWQNEMIHQRRVGRLSHAVTERAVRKWRQLSTSTACVCAAGEHFEHMLKWRWCDVTRVTFWVIIIANCICRYSVNNFWANAITHTLPAVPVGIHCCQWPSCDFCISHGSVVTTLRWSGQNYRPLHQVSS